MPVAVEETPTPAVEQVAVAEPVVPEPEPVPTLVSVSACPLGGARWAMGATSSKPT